MYSPRPIRSPLPPCSTGGLLKNGCWAQDASPIEVSIKEIAQQMRRRENIPINLVVISGTVNTRWRISVQSGVGMAPGVLENQVDHDVRLDERTTASRLKPDLLFDFI